MKLLFDEPLCKAMADLQNAFKGNINAEGVYIVYFKGDVNRIIKNICKVSSKEYAV